MDTRLAPILLLVVVMATSAAAQTLRWAARADAESMDPHTIAETQAVGMALLVYDTLVERDPELNVVPGLAVRWQALGPLRWRFELRRGVRFHDGTPLEADDVVFSILRAQQPTSQLSFYAQPLGRPVKIDRHTVELQLPRPNPLVLQHAAQVAIMSRAWAEAHRAARVPDFKTGEEAYTTRHAMGTGRYVLKARAPGVRSVYERNPGWWGYPAAGAAPADARQGNVERIVFTPIGHDATRTAALVGGDVDFVTDLPMQDADRVRATPGLGLVQAPESRLIFLGFNQALDALPGSDVTGANPLRDVRVREAFTLAIDAEALRTGVMRGLSQPTRCMAVARAGCMAPELESAAPADPERAKRLLAEAGYPRGFSLAIDCPNDRYQRDQALCQAVAGMLARVGVQLKVDARPKAQWLPKIQSGDTALFLLGWAGSFPDAQPLLDPVVHGAGTVPGKGGSNFGGSSDAQADQAIDAAATEADPVRRAALIAAAQRRVVERFLYVPLHRQTLFWGTRAGVQTVPTPNGVVRADWMHVP